MLLRSQALDDELKGLAINGRAVDQAASSPPAPLIRSQSDPRPRMPGFLMPTKSSMQKQVSGECPLRALHPVQ